VVSIGLRSGLDGAPRLTGQHIEQRTLPLATSGGC